MIDSPKSSSPLVSIVIPMYNAERFIERCLSSVLAQTYTNIELLVIDDCSSDTSVAIVEKMAKQSAMSIRLLSQEQCLGASASRNRGIREANGIYIYFLDSDDEISKDAIESLVLFAEKNQLEMVMGDYWTITPLNEKKYFKVDVSHDLYVGNDEILRLYADRKLTTMVWNKLVRRDVVLSNNLYFVEGHIIEDEHWSFCAAASISSLGIVHKPTYVYRIRRDSTFYRHLKSEYRWREYLHILKEIRAYIRLRNLNTNLFVNRWFMFDLLICLNAFDKVHKMDYAVYKELVSLKNFSLLELKKHGMISFKEFVAYLYFSMPPMLGYIYRGILGYYFKA